MVTSPNGINGVFRILQVCLWCTKGILRVHVAVNMVREVKIVMSATEPLLCIPKTKRVQVSLKRGIVKTAETFSWGSDWLRWFSAVDSTPS